MLRDRCNRCLELDSPSTATFSVALEEKEVVSLFSSLLCSGAFEIDVVVDFEAREVWEEME